MIFLKNVGIRSISDFQYNLQTNDVHWLLICFPLQKLATILNKTCRQFILNTMYFFRQEITSIDAVLLIVRFFQRKCVQNSKISKFKEFLYKIEKFQGLKLFQFCQESIDDKIFIYIFKSAIELSILTMRKGYILLQKWLEWLLKMIRHFAYFCEIVPKHLRILFHGLYNESIRKIHKIKGPTNSCTNIFNFSDLSIGQLIECIRNI